MTNHESCLTFHTFSVAKAGSTVEISLYNYTIVHFRNLKHEECFFYNFVLAVSVAQ